MTKTPAPTDQSASAATAATGPVFRLDLPHGRCVGLRIPSAEADTNPGLPAAEWEFLASLPSGRRASFASGRRALRQAFADLGMPITEPLLPLPLPRGGPALPAGALGSISHKRTLAVGLAAIQPVGAPAAALGVDLEEIRPLKVDLGRRVLTPSEREMQASLPREHQDEFVLERFSLKEAFYKAVNGFVGPDVSFQALEITDIRPSGEVIWSAPLLEQFGLRGEGWVHRPTTGFLLTSVFVETAP
ncbi:MAG TPA: 4'-phosphopantetheinyl transferase superfamily protein [Polyangia bacterium]